MKPEQCKYLAPGIDLAPAFTFALLNWYDANRRSLPWRDHPDPYAVLVSEFMLQQTTVPAVLSYFDKWLQQYPTVEALADAALDEVLLQWEGLGYYSRARNLHAAAGEIVSVYGGVVPKAPEDLKKLPGIGDYTAAAVASMAYGIRAPALDANNLRVWSRLLAASDRKGIGSVFYRVLPSDRPGDFNQALMDLGSSICTPKNPVCPVCPLTEWCRAYRGDRVSEFPPKKIRPDTVHIEAAIGIILRDGKVLVQKRAETGLMAGLWEFPGGKINRAQGAGRGAQETYRPFDGETEGLSDKEPIETPEEAVVREVREETGLRIQICEKLGVFTHAYTKFRVKLHVFICKRKAGKNHNPTAKWVTLEELEELAMPSVNRRIVKRLEKHLDNDSDD